MDCVCLYTLICTDHHLVPDCVDTCHGLLLHATAQGLWMEQPHCPPVDFLPLVVHLQQMFGILCQGHDVPSIVFDVHVGVNASLVLDDLPATATVWHLVFELAEDSDFYSAPLPPFSH